METKKSRRFEVSDTPKTALEIVFVSCVQRFVPEAASLLSGNFGEPENRSVVGFCDTSNRRLTT